MKNKLLFFNSQKPWWGKKNPGGGKLAPKVPKWSICCSTVAVWQAFLNTVLNARRKTYTW